MAPGPTPAPGAVGAGGIPPEIVEVQPCTEEGLVTLEAWLGGRGCEAYFDPALLCRLILASPFFESVRCSDQMGYGIAERESHRLHVFKNGKVIVRRAPGRERALALLALAARCLWGARLCSDGRPVLTALLSEEGPSSLPAPPGDAGGPALAPLGEAIRLAKAQPLWSSVERGLGLLRTTLDEMAAGGSPENRQERFRRAEAHFLDYIGGTEEPLAASAGLPLLALSLSLDRAASALEPVPMDERGGVWGALAEVVEAVASGRVEEHSRLRERLILEAEAAGADPGPLLAPVNLLRP
ncbi:MAG: hypothetical protein ACUVV6_04010 [Thermoplasmatota archaeon]